MSMNLSELEARAARLRTEIKTAEGWGLGDEAKVEELALVETRIYAAKLRIARDDDTLIRPYMPPAYFEMWGNVPSYMHEGICNYLNFGMISGDFLMSIFRNNLSEAVTRADGNNRWALIDYVHLLYAIAPVGSWGGDDFVREWVKHGGLYGLRSSKTSSLDSASSPLSSSLLESPRESSDGQ